MSHRVTGIIATAEILTAFATHHALPGPVPLEAGLALIPLRDRDLDAILPLPLTGATTGFTYLSDPLIAALAAASSLGRVMYFKTEYIGGAGAQAAIVLERGDVIHGPECGERGPINRALALLGVTARSPAADAFEMVGLARHRRTADWLAVDDDD